MTACERERSTVLCVDDNAGIAEALRMKFSSGPLHWLGWLPDATDLVEKVKAECPAIVLLDLDMPGPDPFEALAQIASTGCATKVVIFSGHVRRELLDKAIEAGAWGYVSKNEGAGALMQTIERVLQGEFALSDEVRAIAGC